MKMINLVKKHYFANIAQDNKVIGHVHSCVYFWQSSYTAFVKMEEWLHSLGYKGEAFITNFHQVK